jgi:hypothetical protein
MGPTSAATQLAGSGLVVTAFILHQRGIMGALSWRYQALNLVGALILAVNGVLERQFGFVLLEGVWAFASGLALMKTSTQATSLGSAP